MTYTVTKTYTKQNDADIVLGKRGVCWWSRGLKSTVFHLRMEILAYTHISMLRIDNPYDLITYLEI